MVTKPHLVAELIEKKLLAVGDGYRAKNSELGTSGLPFARAANIRDQIDVTDAERFPVKRLAVLGGKVSQPGDVVFTSKGTVGRFAFVSIEQEPFVYSPQLCYWRSLDHSVIDPRFLYYWMRGDEFLMQCEAVKGQTDMADYVSLTEQYRMTVTLPEIEDQRTVGQVLGTLDQKIAVNRRMSGTLEAMAQAIFKSWFVDFDPVLAKAEGSQPFGIDTKTAALFSSRFVESGIGPIPESFREARLDEVISVNVRSIDSRYPHEDIEYIDISSVSKGELLGTTTHALRTAPSRARRLVRDGDTIWSCVRPNRMSYFYIDEPARNLVVSTGFAVLSPGDVPPSFLYHHVTRTDFVEYLTANAEGSAYPAVRPETFESANVVVPPRPILEEYDRVVHPMMKAISHHARESRLLGCLRDLLLPKLLSGEIRLKQAEKLVGEAV